MSEATLLLTFDDRHIDTWTEARGIFDKHGARATFFVVEADLLDAAEQTGLQTLAADGHSIGSHGLRHLNAPEMIMQLGADEFLHTEIKPSVDALDSIGISASTYAYPNSRGDAVSDRVLLDVFDRLRGGCGRSAEPSDTTDLIISDHDIADARVLIGRGWDTGRGNDVRAEDLDVLLALINTLANRGGYLTLYAHEIARAGEGNHLDPDRLDFVLGVARELGLRIQGWNDLPS